MSDTRVGWRQYLHCLEFLATDELARKELVARRLSRGWCLGSRSFKQDQQKEAARRRVELERARYAGTSMSAPGAAGNS